MRPPPPERGAGAAARSLVAAMPALSRLLLQSNAYTELIARELPWQQMQVGAPSMCTLLAALPAKQHLARAW